MSGREFTYAVVGGDATARVVTSGPRRIKLISRYLFTPEDGARVPYGVTVHVDGREVLRKRFTGKPLAKVSRCDDDGRVGSLRRGYIELPAGEHEIVVRAETAGEGRVAVRLFRQVRRQRDRWMSVVPDDYDAVRHLQFESGSRSTYYWFTGAQPLRKELSGETELRVRTRLDFDHTMHGDQMYTLAVYIDDEHWRSFDLDSHALSSAVWLDVPDVLPGDRDELRVPVPRGDHTVEIRCIRPTACGVAAMLHIPERDLER